MFTPPNMSHVMCHVSHHESRVMCHVSRVTCHVSHVLCHNFFSSFFFGQSGEAYWWRLIFQTLSSISPNIIVFFLPPYTWLESYGCHGLFGTNISGSLSFSPVLWALSSRNTLNVTHSNTASYVSKRKRGTHWIAPNLCGAHFEASIIPLGALWRL